MRDRAEQILRIACWILGALVVCDLIAVGFRATPLLGAKIPALPTLSAEAEAGAAATNAPSQVSAGRGANGTNGMANFVAATNSASTNTLARAGTNQTLAANGAGLTNAAAPKAETNSVRAAASTNAAVSVAVTNHPASDPVAVRSVPPTNALAAGTNLSSPMRTNRSTQIAKAGTNTASPGATNIESGSPTNSSRPRHGPAMAAGNPRPGRMPGMRGADLPPATQARVDRVIASEIFGQIPQPLPMALLGIAGDYAIIRTDTGQTGLVKLGDELGGVKLVRIGINRVVIEQNGEEKELTIFSGFGSDSLLTKKESPK